MNKQTDCIERLAEDGPFDGWYVGIELDVIDFSEQTWQNGTIKNDDIFGPFGTKADAAQWLRDWHKETE